MDCVCDKCNMYFSTLEIELIQKSIVGLMRSVEGIEGYNPNKEKPAPFKAPILLIPDEENEVVYEVGQFHQMKVFVRPQVIKIKNKYYIEADSQEGKTKLSKKYKYWKTNSLRMIIHKPSSKEDTLRFVEFKKFDSGFNSEIKNEHIKPKHEITLTLLSEDHECYRLLTPRLYIDDNDKLRIRAKTVDDAIDFLIEFLMLSSGDLTLYSYGRGNFNQPIVQTGFSFDTFKFEQALVKIGINCLIYYFPQIKNDISLNDCISFVMKGDPLIRRMIEEKSTIIDNNDKTHNIFFHQVDDMVRVRISLFNGSVVFTFLIPQLKILKANEYNRLVIDYANRIHGFEDFVAFFKSFNKPENHQHILPN